MRGPKRHLSEDDRTVWHAYALTVRRIRPLDPGVAAAAPQALAAPGRGEEVPVPLPPSAAAPRPVRRSIEIGGRGEGLDDRSFRALADGRLAATRRLDLHGARAEAAFAAVASFLHAASADGHRCVEIITGHGKGPEGGVLKRELPHWLNRPELRRLLVAATHPRPGNAGAVRLLLARRPR